MPLGWLQRRSRWLRLVTAVALLAGLTACDDRWSRLDPPRLVQLSCKPVAGDATMVLVIDTGLHSVTWSNAAGGPQGVATVTEQLYRLRFDPSSQASAWEAVVRRYDGVMEREIGTAPFSAGKALRAGNLRETWRCAAEKPGPKL